MENLKAKSFEIREHVLDDLSGKKWTHRRRHERHRHPGSPLL